MSNKCFFFSSLLWCIQESVNNKKKQIIKKVKIIGHNDKCESVFCLCKHIDFEIEMFRIDEKKFIVTPKSQAINPKQASDQ